MNLITLKDAERSTFIHVGVRSLYTNATNRMVGSVYAVLPESDLEVPPDILRAVLFDYEANWQYQLKSTYGRKAEFIRVGESPDQYVRWLSATMFDTPLKGSTYTTHTSEFIKFYAKRKFKYDPSAPHGYRK